MNPQESKQIRDTLEKATALCRGHPQDSIIFNTLQDIFDIGYAQGKLDALKEQIDHPNKGVEL